MRTLILLIAAIASSAPTYGQGNTPPDAKPPRDGIAFGGLVTPALEGGGPWIMPAVRLSLPLGSRFGFDVETGRVFGGVNPKYGSIRRYSLAQLRVLRAPRETDDIRRYWLAGLQHLPITYPDRPRKDHIGLAAGHGWSQSFRNGVRLTSELGFAGGEGFLFYVNACVQWEPRRRRG